MQVEWSQLLECSRETVSKEVKNRTGIYKLLWRGKDGKFLTFYVGSSTTLQTRIPEHFDEDETNKCVKDAIKGLDCTFRFAYADSEEKAQGAERFLYEHYVRLLKLCNDRVPPAKPIEINLT